MPGIACSGRWHRSRCRFPLWRSCSARHCFLPVASGQSPEAPEITSLGPFSVDEGSTTVATLTATDADTAVGDLVWSIAGGADEAMFSLTAGGELSFSSAKDFEHPDDADMDGSYEITVQVSDGTNTDSADLVVSLTDVPEPPAITTTSPLSVAEGETAVATLRATDDETAAADLTWTMTGGADQDKFSLTTAGVLALNAAADYESPDDADTDRSYEITVQVSDGSMTDSADLLVELTNVTELASQITGLSSVSFGENSYVRVATYSASSDEDRDGVTWTITGDDAAHFSIDSPSGALRFDIDPVLPIRFARPPDYESAVDSDTNNDYKITLQASAGTDTTTTFDVTVNVTDVDEAGELSLSDYSPSQGAALTLTLTDQDGVTVGTPVYKWERSLQPNAWAVITGATSASYMPNAVDVGTFLRATATYDDAHGTNKTATAITYEVVTGSLLTGLAVTTVDSTGNAERALSPSFSGEILHYVIGCDANDTMTVTPTAAAGVRLSVDGVQVASGTSRTVSVTGSSDVRIAVTSADGASTTYVVHCLAEKLWTVEAIKNDSSIGIIEDLMLFRITNTMGVNRTFVFMDHNGVPRFQRNVESALSAYVRVEKVTVDAPGTDGFEYRYSYITGGHNIILDQDLKQFGTSRTVSPLRSLDAHDQRVLENGNYLLMVWPERRRNLSGLSFEHPEVQETQPQTIRDSAFQIVTPSRRAVFTWYAWGKAQLEDCVQHRFPNRYSHLNSLQMMNGLVIISLRGCSTVMAIDPQHDESHKVAWRVGRTNLSAAEWEARNVGPAPLTIVGDPAGEFCGQHAAQVLPSGNLLLHDNGVACLINPWTGMEEGRTSLDYSRAVEYALDFDNGEAVFVRDHSLHSAEKYVGYASGHVELLTNGDWLITWGGAGRASPAVDHPPDEWVTQVDPDTGEEKFALTNNGGLDRAVPVHPVALFSKRQALNASFPASSHSSVFHKGATDSPQIVVAFNRPVVDFDATSPSLSVTGGTVASVSAHVVAGEPANTYLITLAPEGAGAVTLTILANQACDSGGICAADGTLLTDVPSAVVIGPPPSITFERAAQNVGEGSTVTVYVRLSAAHQGVRAVSVPIELDLTTTTSTEVITAGAPVTFEAGETRKSFFVLAPEDDLVEGPETATLTFGAPRDSLTTGTNATLTVTVADTDRAQISYLRPISQVAEGGSTRLRFTITNALTFERDQQITLTVGGSATHGDDFVLLDASSLTPPTQHSVTFPAGTASTSFRILVIDDSEIEAVSESITFSATLDLTGASLGLRTVTIPPSDVPDTPIVTIVQDGNVTEGEAAAFTLSRTISNRHPLSEQLTVAIRASADGSTLGGSGPSSATFLADEATVTVEVATLDDAVVEPAGAVTVLVLGGTGAPPPYLVGAANAAAVTVEDNDTAAFSVEASADEVAEGGAVTITVTGDGVTFAEPQTIALTLAGTASVGDDFTVSGPAGELTAPYMVTLPRGPSSVAVMLKTLRDHADDVDETVVVMFHHDGVSIGAGTFTIGPPPPVVITTGGGGGGAPALVVPSDEDFDWNVTRDIESLHSDQDSPTGMWSDGQTLWVLENAASGADHVFAYVLTTGEPDLDKLFELDRRNRFSHGLWSDGETAWVADSGQDRLFAYIVETGVRVEQSDLELAEDNKDPRGIWADDGMLYVLDSVKDALFVYDFESGELLSEHQLDTLNKSPRGIWSDGDVMYVADEQDDHIYTYNMPDAIDARLASITFDGEELEGFSPNTTTYRIRLDAEAQTWLLATPSQSEATLTIEPSGQQTDPERGHEIALAELDAILVTVTSSDRSRTRTYRIELERPSCLSGLTEEQLSVVEFVGGSVADLETCLRNLNLAGVFHYQQSGWTSLFLDAPQFLSNPLRSRFAQGIAPGESFVVKRSVPPADAGIASDTN